MNTQKLMLTLAGLLLASGASAQMRVSTGDALKNATTKPQPVYSSVAKQMKVAGRVEVEALVTEAGSVESVKPVNGNPLLTQSAVAAVQKWKFTPFTEDGKPSKAVVILSFDFRP